MDKFLIDGFAPKEYGNESGNVNDVISIIFFKYSEVVAKGRHAGQYPKENGEWGKPVDIRNVKRGTYLSLNLCWFESNLLIKKYVKYTVGKWRISSTTLGNRVTMYSIKEKSNRIA